MYERTTIAAPAVQTDSTACARLLPTAIAEIRRNPLEQQLAWPQSNQPPARGTAFWWLRQPANSVYPVAWTGGAATF